MPAYHALQSVMQDVRRRVSATDGIPSIFIDLRFDRIPFFDFTGSKLAVMNDQVTATLRVGNFEGAFGGRDIARVPDLPAAFPVKRGAIQNNANHVRGIRGMDRADQSVLFGLSDDDSFDLSFCVSLFVA